MLSLNPIREFVQSRLARPAPAAPRRPSGVFIICLALLWASLAPHALAASTGFEPDSRKVVTYKTSFADLKQGVSPLIDWRRPVSKLAFDIPDSAWVESVEVLLSADPMGPQAPKGGLTVSLNGSSAVSLQPDGHSFDAHITLDRSQIRARRNTIELSYQSENAACPGPSQSGWELDLDNSLLVVTARTKLRPANIGDIKSLLTSPATRPKTVAIRTAGPHALKWSALAAQGVSLQMGAVPDFQTTAERADFGIVVATRDQLAGLTKDEFVLTETGALIATAESDHPEIVITGDNEAEVLAALEAFASFHLPDTYRRKTTPGELMFRTPFSISRRKLDGRKALSNITPLSFDQSWGTDTKTAAFDVSNPLGRSGDVTLRLQSSRFVDPNSFVSLRLNGKPIGRTQLDRRIKTVQFPIPGGVLKGLDNRLEIISDLTPSAGISPCADRPELTGFAILPGSSVNIDPQDLPSMDGLSSFASNGQPFSVQSGLGTTVLFTAADSQDFGPSLKLLGQTALASGESWKLARYVDEASAVSQARKLLILGPHTAATDALLAQSPRGLSVALGGQPRGPVSKKTAAYSQDGAPVRLMQASPSTYVAGGLAALYEDRKAGRTVGIITAAPGESFRHQVDRIVELEHWNALEGSVAKWDGDQVVMVQTSMPGHKTSPGQAYAQARPSIISRLSSARITVPDLGLQHRWTVLSDYTASLARQIGDRARTLRISVLQRPKPQTHKTVVTDPDLSVPMVTRLSGPNAVLPRLKPAPQPGGAENLPGFSAKESGPLDTAPAPRPAMAKWAENGLDRAGDLITAANARIGAAVENTTNRFAMPSPRRRDAAAPAEGSVLLFAGLFSVFLIVMGVMGPRRRY